MIQEYAINSRQNIYDVALQVYGSSDFAYQVAQDNGLNLDSVLERGTTVKYDDALGIPDAKQAYVDRQLTSYNFYEPAIETQEIDINVLNTSVAWLRVSNPDFLAAIASTTATSAGNTSVGVLPWQIIRTANWLVSRGGFQAQIPAELQTVNIRSARIVMPIVPDLNTSFIQGAFFRYTGSPTFPFSEFDEFAEQISERSTHDNNIYTAELNDAGIALVQAGGVLRFMGRAGFDIDAEVPPEEIVRTYTVDLPRAKLIVTYEV